MSELMEANIGDRYKVDSNGVVYTKATLGSKSKVCESWRSLKPFKSGRGYLQVNLGRKNRQYVHRLVFEGFTGEIETGLEINHINGIKTDNRVCNLEKISKQENMRHAWNNGLMKSRSFNMEQVAQIKSMALSGIKVDVISKSFGVHAATVYRIISGKSYSRCIDGMQ